MNQSMRHIRKTVTQDAPKHVILTYKFQIVIIMMNYKMLLTKPCTIDEVS